MTNHNSIHQYQTCDSTGPQHLNPDPEFGTPIGELLTIGETAQQQHPNLMPPQALLEFAFGLGFQDDVLKTGVLVK
jgi:hypothetical protein